MKIKINDFQSLGQTEIEATGLTVVVGRSNLGKSALVRAITAALFNRPGEDFIRVNRTYAAVTLDGLPTMHGPPMRVEWVKGHNLNQFTVNGVAYKKVGIEAPPVIAAAGYKDIFIGDKERSKGEEIRPQIAGQFDPPFLLDRAGSFVNDVLSVVSRLGVLLNANGRCAKDLKAAKALVTTRKKDLIAADARVAALQPVVDLHLRVEALQARLVQARKDAALVAKVQTLLTGRAALKAFCDRALPDPVMVPEDLGVKESALARLVTARRALAPVCGRTLPPERFYLIAALELDVRKVTEGVRLVAQRAPMVTVASYALPADDTARLAALLEACQTQVKVRDEVRERLAQQAASTTAVFHAVSTLNGVMDTETEADVALANALATIDICPICERPMEKAPVPV